MPDTNVPTVPTEKLPFREGDAPKERIRIEDLSLEQLNVLGERASREAQAELHKQGLSYFIGRDGKVIEVLPSGEERVRVPER